MLHPLDNQAATSHLLVTNFSNSEIKKIKENSYMLHCEQ